MQPESCYIKYFSQLASLTLLATLNHGVLAAPAPIAINSATFNAKAKTLIVKTTVKNTVTGNLSLLHGEGGLLESRAITKAKETFSIPLTQLGQAPCSIEIQAGSNRASKAVAGAPADCAKMPVCKIISPKAGPVSAQVGVPVNFEGQVLVKDKKAKPATIEWDFAGGAFNHPNTPNATATFIRNDSTYRVRFTAFDANKRYCQASIDVNVGTPPTGLPSKVSEQTAASRGSELDGTKSDIVVMPFEEWSYQNWSDMGFKGNGYSSFSPVANSIRAYAFQKDRLPLFLNNNNVELRYSAASNPLDPVGANSINSTSRNWPVTKAFADADVQKTDMWEIFTRADSEKSADYFACSWAMTGYWGAYGCGDAQGLPTADEGYFKAKKDSSGNVVPNDPNNTDHGLYMPGRDNPYQANTAQAFSKFIATQKALVAGGTDKPAAWFAANMLPITDTDDQGRVNGYPLMRVEAVTKGTENVVAKTDSVVSTGRDFHCRECHAKGQVAANPNAGHTAAAFNSSAWGAFSETQRPTPADKKLSKPKFYDVADFGGDPNSIYDQEYAAALNYSSIHQFYDKISFLDDMLNGIVDSSTGKVTKDTPKPCYGCHATAIAFTPFNNAWWDEEGFKVKDPIYAPNYSISMHRFHGELQWKDDTKTEIVRDDKGSFQRWDWKTKGPNNSTSTRSLFPIFDANGKQLPMEENCLKCHNGHREQIYRDRMYTAGVTCFDCHGDMLAVGEAFPKNYLANKAKLGSTERDDYRVPWYDEPDCGSCHVGTGNIGADKANGFFSAGVKKKAFADDDWSATSFAVDKTNVNGRRFSAAPLENYKANFATDFWYGDEAQYGEFLSKTVDTKVDAPLFREGKDRHGNVACAACHGAAHAVWPNRDPKANDNVTALQLQGHTGTILECNVCHSADSFAKFEDLDGGANYSGDSKPGILGGPHDMHPVNDPYWWKEATGDTVDSTPDSPKRKGGVIKGGWHNDYAKIGGKDGEDQCAACHGVDHKGSRLSKTPVDREFINEKGKKVAVKAGSQIGCDLCHTLDKSFTGSPAKR